MPVAHQSRWHLHCRCYLVPKSRSYGKVCEQICFRCRPEIVDAKRSSQPLFRSKCSANATCGYRLPHPLPVSQQCVGCAYPMACSCGVWKPACSGGCSCAAGGCSAAGRKPAGCFAGASGSVATGCCVAGCAAGGGPLSEAKMLVMAACSAASLRSEAACASFASRSAACACCASSCASCSCCRSCECRQR